MSKKNVLPQCRKLKKNYDYGITKAMRGIMI